jgi:hypothetical protein
MNEGVVLDRDALYYPFIHITDVNWLKATLLCFPGVRRMVPQSYVPTDSDAVREFCDVEGPRGEPLLTRVDLFSRDAKAAEERLLATLEKQDSKIRSRFSERVTMKALAPDDLYQLHDEKIVARLYSYLTDGKPGKALAWRIPPPANRPHRAFGQWLALHPALGNAILSVKAMALAKSLGLDIVTDATHVHEVVAGQTEEDVLAALLGEQLSTKKAPATDDTVDDLAEIVMRTAFDVRGLTAKQIGQLLADGHDLRRFKNALVPIVAGLPAITDQDERRKRLEAAAADVLKQWKKYKKSLPRFALDALVETADVEWPKIVSTGGLLAVEQTRWVGAGLGVALLAHKGVKVLGDYREHRNGPYRYLSRIQKVSAHTQTALSIAPPR